MTPAELLVTRKACGRSNAWLADACGVDLRTAQRWQSPKRWQDVPEFAAEIARAELAMIAEMADYACAVIEDHPADRRVVRIDRDDPRTVAVAWRVLERFPDCEIQFRETPWTMLEAWIAAEEPRHAQAIRLIKGEATA